MTMLRRVRGRFALAAAASVLVALVATGCQGPPVRVSVTLTMSCWDQRHDVATLPEDREVTFNLDAPAWADPGSRLSFTRLRVQGAKPPGVDGYTRDSWLSVTRSGTTAVSPHTRISTTDGFNVSAPPDSDPAGVAFGSAGTTLTAPAGTTAVISVADLGFATDANPYQATRCIPKDPADAVLMRIRSGRP